MILVLDNYDSFTYNLVQYLGELGAQVQVIRNDETTVAGVEGVVGSAMRRTSEVRVDLNALIRRANLLALSFKEAADSLSVHSARLSATPSIMPTQGWLSSAFSSMRSHPILHVARPHEGIDVTAPMGTPMGAAMNDATHLGWWLSDFTLASGVHAGGKNFFDDFSVRSAVPEPTSWALALCGVGAGVLSLIRRRRRAAK